MYRNCNYHFFLIFLYSRKQFLVGSGNTDQRTYYHFIINIEITQLFRTWKDVSNGKTIGRKIHQTLRMKLILYVTKNIIKWIVLILNLWTKNHRESDLGSYYWDAASLKSDWIDWGGGVKGFFNTSCTSHTLKLRFSSYYSAYNLLV